MSLLVLATDLAPFGALKLSRDPAQKTATLPAAGDAAQEAPSLATSGEAAQKAALLAHLALLAARLLALLTLATAGQTADGAREATAVLPVIY